MNKVIFNGVECDVVFDQYENGRTAIRLIEDGMPYAMATMNDPEVWLEPNQVIIKDYSENKGMAEALEKAGIVERDKLIVINLWGTTSWVCNLLVNP